MTSPDPSAEPTCYRHPERVTYVSCTRCGRHICGEDQVPASVGFHCPDDVREANRGVRTARTAYGGRLTGTADVTRVLVGFNVAVFVAAILGGGADLVSSGGDSPLHRLFAMQPVTLREGDGGLTRGVADGEVYRLLTAAFLHYGIPHLLLNCLALLQLGPELERALGRARFLALYLLSGLAGSAATFSLGPENARAAGASGAIYGLAGAWLIVTRRRAQDQTPIVLFLVLGVLMTLVIPNIDWRAHLGGLLGGAACGAALFIGNRNGRRQAVQVSGLVVVFLVVVLVVALRAAALQPG